MKGGHAQRASDVGAQRQRAITGRERRRGATGRAARRAAEIERVVGSAVNLIVALPVAKPDRHVGLAEDDAARILDAGNRQRVLGRHKILLRWNAPGCWQACDVEGFLHRHREAEQRLLHPARQGVVGGTGGGEAAFEITHADRVDLAVMPLDAADRIPRQFDRADFPGGQRRGQFGGGCETPLRFWQSACSRSHS